jgi:hypothetical protein
MEIIQIDFLTEINLKIKITTCYIDVPMQII